MKILFKIILIIIIISFVLVLSGYFLYRSNINKALSSQSKDVNFTIAQGQSVKEIGANLQKENLIKSAIFFELFVERNNKQNKLQAGDYVLSPSLSIIQIVDLLTEGKVKNKEKTIKIIEGWNISDIAKYLEKNEQIPSQDFLQLVDYSQTGNFEQFTFLNDKPKDHGLEGYLFPDTYRVFNDAKSEDIVNKMLLNFDKKLTSDMRLEIAKQNKTIFEIISMASIIEKEVRSVEDMEVVSGIFWDRIKNGQALESCATLAYILGVDKKQYTVEDTKINSSYNTYQNIGLPPGPICNPGINAIKAAIYPKFTDYNYFLTSSIDGKTIFSRTYDEHLLNKAKYLK